MAEIEQPAKKKIKLPSAEVVINELRMNYTDFEEGDYVFIPEHALFFMYDKSRSTRDVIGLWSEDYGDLSLNKETLNSLMVEFIVLRIEIAYKPPL